jgi:SynChlorMet cassette protein ScmC
MNPPAGPSVRLRDLLQDGCNGGDASIPDQGFCLDLADGNRWWLTACTPTFPWLTRLAAIMELPPGLPDGRPELIYTEALPARDLAALGFVPEEVGWGPKGQRPLRCWRHPGLPDVLCELHHDGSAEFFLINMWNSLTVIYLDSVWRGGLPLHAGLAAFQGQGVLFAAPGDTGKSTTCRRLPRPWEMLDDDETLVVKTPGAFYVAHPFPTWSDYLFQRGMPTWNVQHTVPVKAVCFLEQHPENRITPLSQAQAAVCITQSVEQIFTRTWENLPREEMVRRRTQVFANAADLALAVPAFRMRLSLHGHFWEDLERLLGWR